ncbi:MAG TPA: hypothetical protein PKC91_01900 [Ignavibacteria bacterium]|nr:hypothetical protein [Ignavibacteria bacterium]
MKKRNLKHLIVLVILFNVSVIYSQSDNKLTDHTTNISLEYFNMTELKSEHIALENIGKLKLIPDSNMNITNEISKVTQVNINKINESVTKISSGETMGVWTGMIIGGTVCGYFAGASVSPGVGRVFSVIGGAIVGAFIGGSIGAVLGGSMFNELNHKHKDINTDLMRNPPINNSVKKYGYMINIAAEK